jgi:predicted ABC-type ATPase
MSDQPHVSGQPHVSDQPNVVVIAGPNGAGKSTVAPFLLQEVLELETFVNADVIATGLSAFAPEKVAIQAGKIMLEQLHRLASQRESFAFETTLASRTFAPFLVSLKQNGYRVSIFFLFLESPELAICRVAQRVLAGGHFIPEADIRRRCELSFNNFLSYYKPLADTWSVWNTSTVLPTLQDSSGNLETIKTVESSLRKAVAKVLKQHERLGESVAVWQDGNVVILEAKHILASLE